MDSKLQLLLKRERQIKLIAVVAILILSVVILLTVDNLLISFVLAFVTNYLLSPVVDLLERRGLNRQMAILVPFLATGALIGFGIYEVLPLLTDQVQALESNLPKYQVEMMNLVALFESRFKGVLQFFGGNLAASVNSFIMDKTTQLSLVLPRALSGSLTVVLLTPILSYFMIRDGRKISHAVLELVPNNLFEVFLNLHHQLNEQMGGFIRARFLEAAIVGLVVWLGLQVSGFPYASLLGLVAALTNLIPYIGPIIGAVPAILIALISKDAMVTESMSINLIIVTSIYFTAQLIDIVFIIPMVVAKIVNLHPVTVIIVIIIGSQLMGILGMMISIPVASALKLISQSIYTHLMELRRT